MESRIRVVKDVQVEVQFIGTVVIVLDLETGYKLVLEKTLYVPSFRQILL